MRLTEFHRLVDDEFGRDSSAFLLDTHVLAEFSATPAELLDGGEEPKRVWEALCRDFRVPKERWLGRDEPGS